MTITPFDFQLKYVAKALETDGFGNFDDMGTGKTVQACEEIRQLQPENVFIVTVKSAISVWEDHVAEMLPEYEVLTPKTSLTKEEVKYIRTNKVIVIVNWAQVRINKDLQRIKWGLSIADEAQALCNRKSQQTKAMNRIKAEHRRAFTGTPVLNQPADLWGILHWLYPKQFTSYWNFYEEFVKYVERHIKKGKYKEIVGTKNTRKLRGILSPIAVRRKKETVFPEMPDKYRTIIRVDLTPEQKRAYKQMRDDQLAWVGEQEDEVIPAPIAIAKLTRLRQFAAAYATAEDITCPKCKGTGRIKEDVCPRCKGLKTIVKVTLTEPSSKLDAVMEIIQGTDESVVVFSQFSQTIDLLEARLKKAKIPTSRMVAGSSDAARRKNIEDFVQRKTRVFISQMKLGGVGIDGLQKVSSTVIFIDRSYSPSDNEQAEDRLHRKGQENAVHVIEIRSKGTVDNEVSGKLEWKKGMIREILEGL